MSAHAPAARPLYLELRALGLEVRAEDDPDGETLDLRISVSGLHRLSETMHKACGSAYWRARKGWCSSSWIKKIRT